MARLKLIKIIIKLIELIIINFYLTILRLLNFSSKKKSAIIFSSIDKFHQIPIINLLKNFRLNRIIFIKNGIDQKATDQLINRYSNEKIIYLNMSDQITLFLNFRKKYPKIHFLYPRYFDSSFYIYRTKFKFKEKIFVNEYKKINVKKSTLNMINFLNFFEINHIPIYISFGTLLGIIRDSKLIDWDTDIDFVVDEKYRKDVLNFLPKLRSLNFELQRYMSEDLMTFLSKGDFVDLYFMRLEKGKYRWRGEGYYLDSEFNNTKNYFIKEFGFNLKIPKASEKLLRRWYGDWRTPINFNDLNKGPINEL
jgi:hypothetical protein